jgi:hypothetical protein
MRRTSAPLTAAVAASGRKPASLEELRLLGPEAAAALDAWMADYSWRLITAPVVPPASRRPAETIISPYPCDNARVVRMPGSQNGRPE